MSAEHFPGHVALAHPFSQAWSTDIGDGSSSSRRLLNPPIVANGRVYAMDTSGYVAAVDAANGRRAWRVQAASSSEESDVLGGGVAFGDGRLYATTGFGEVLALDPANGDVLWRAEANGPIRAAPAFAAGRIFVISIDNQLEPVAGQSLKVGHALYADTTPTEVSIPLPVSMGRLNRPPKQVRPS